MTRNSDVWPVEGMDSRVIDDLIVYEKHKKREQERQQIPLENRIPLPGYLEEEREDNDKSYGSRTVVIDPENDPNTIYF